jgi:glucose-1-phosphate cytidylyltransferase
MKAVILAGGKGTRISEETILKPKPLIEIGGMPIIWHIMKIYSAHGINEFVICCGYKGHLIKEFFANYSLNNSDLTIDLKSNDINIHKKHAEPWKITLVDTGLETMTGGRLKKVKKFVDDQTFCFTYGDGISDVNITKLIKFHNKKKKEATVTIIQPQNRFGVLEIKNDLVSKFKEKPIHEWINGGFFLLEPKIFDYIKSDKTVWEKEPLEILTKKKQLAGFKHTGFWQPIDTLRDKNLLEEMWNKRNAKWKVW